VGSVWRAGIICPTPCSVCCFRRIHTPALALLDGLLAGEQTAQSLGINVTRLRMEVFFCCALATSLLVALTGVIGFIGLMVPHMCRYFSGVKHLLLLPLCGLWGAVLLCGGDIVSRTLLARRSCLSTHYGRHRRTLHYYSAGQKPFIN
jgi:ABC-type Fe3+-siderophore transport system permease subunit